MAVHINTNIVTDGLVICLDPSNPSSFTSSTTLADISLRRIGEFTIYGSPTILTNKSVSSINLPFGQTTKYIQLNPSFHPNGDITVMVGAKLGNNTNDNIVYSYASSGTNNNEFLIAVTSAGVRSLVRNNNITFNSLIPTPNTYNIVTATRNTSTPIQKCFLNLQKQELSNSSQQTATVLSNGSLNIGQEQDSLGGGFNSSEVFNGDFYFCLVYDRVLEDKEVYQNYYALRGRGF